MSMDKVLERATAAALKRSKGNGKGNPDLPVGDPVHLWGKPIPKNRRCTFVSSSRDPKRKGKGCKNWAMKGAKRCAVHGGYRQNPEHPATIRRLDDVIESRNELSAAQTLRSHPNKARAHIENTLRDMGGALTPTVVLEGVLAYEQDDNGKAFRRWRDNAVKNTPKLGKNGHKRTLNSRKGAR